ncbi:MAG: hypothetical protein ACU0CA_09420 [Paracoccaceae bacterium]
MTGASRPRIIVHAGFHKTGTTSLQDFLSNNHDALAPYLDSYGKTDFVQAGAYARIYGQRPYFWRRLKFRRSFRRFLKTIPDAKSIVLSKEAFGGAMPGHRDAFRRQIETMAPTAIPLAHEIIRELRNHFGPETEITFLYTTRAPDLWLRSVYGHLLRSIHLSQKYETFRDSFARLPDPQAEANKIAHALHPIPVLIADLEDFANHREGPAAAILDLIDIPDAVRQTLSPAKHSNSGQSAELEAQFLTLNRSNRPKNQLKHEKDRMLEAARKAAGHD